MDIVYRALVLLFVLWVITRVVGRTTLGEFSAFARLTAAFSSASRRWPRTRPIVHALPVVVMRSGEPLLATMRDERLSFNELAAAARAEGIERFTDIQLALLEVNGRISFFSRSARASSGAADQPAAGA